MRKSWFYTDLSMFSSINNHFSSFNAERLHTHIATVQPKTRDKKNGWSSEAYFALMKNFAAIDFETANQQRTSVCSVGIVIVRDGEIVDSYYSLIKPEPEYYSYWNTRVHGLTMEDTMNARVFPDVWAEIQPKIEGLPLVAHNSPFDEGCLKAVFRMYQMEYPGYDFHCTCRASRRKLGSLLPNHQLQTVAAYCGYDLTLHHNALADAEACAWIARELL